MSRKMAATVMAIIGFLLVASGSYFIWKVWVENWKAELLKDKLAGIHNAGADLDSGIDAGLLALHDQNPDCIYWLRIPDTDIDYPVMHHPAEKDYYLARDFNREWSVHGTLYMAEDCDPAASDNRIIYGHHMQDGSMFAGLEEFKKQSFYLEHKHIELETLSGHEEYTIVAAFSVPVYTDHDFQYYAFINAEDEAAYDRFISECRKRSYYETGQTAVYGQQLLTLSTCEYSHKNGRMVIVAVRTDREVIDAGR